MDTLIGKFSLTENQVKNLWTLKIHPFKGVSYKFDGDIVAVSESTPTDVEVSAMHKAISDLPEELDVAVYENAFISKTMTHRLGDTFQGIEAVNLAPYLGAMQSYADAKNFNGIKEFIGGLVALGKATQAQADKMSAIFLEQGIDLSKY